MIRLAAVFGLALFAEGTVKMIAHQNYMRWLTRDPVAYMPEAVVNACRGLRDLSPGALRLLAALEIVCGITIMSLAQCGGRRTGRWANCGR